MKKDIFEMVEKKEKDIVVFEINDKGRDSEFKGGPGYVDAFIGFLESLGFEPVREYEQSSNVTIEGIKFGIGIGNASYMSRNSYTREENVRKPKNRFVALEKGYESIAIKVHINQEIDATNIKARIKKAIQDANTRLQAIEDRQNVDRDNTIAIGEHFLSPTVKKYVDTIYIEKGNIQFNMKGVGAISLRAADGSFKDVSFYYPKCESLKALESIVRASQTEMAGILETAEEIIKAKILPAKLAEWTLTAYHRRYSVKDGKVLEY